MDELHRVHVIWYDTKCNAGWIDDTFVHKPVTVFQIGYRVHDNGTTITLASSYFVEDGIITYGDVTVIPKGCIKEISSL